MNIGEARTFLAQRLIGKIPGRLFEYVRFLDQSRLKKMQNVNGIMSRDVSVASRNNQNVHRSGIVKFFPKIPFEVELDYDDLITLVDFQVFSNMDIISYPDYKVRADKYLKNLDKVSQYLRSKTSRYEIMPYVNTLHSIDVFKSKVEGILDRGYPSIGLEIRGGLGIYPQLTFVQRRLNDENIWIHASNVTPRYPHSNLSYVHLLPYFGIDTFAKTIFLPPYDPVKRIVPKLDPLAIRRFDPLTLGLLKYETHKEKYGRDLKCECTVCVGRDLERFYQGSDREVVARAKTHDFLASSLELDRAREHIARGEFKDYLLNKEYARPILTSLEAISRRLD